ncbi:MAG: extracellular solute-binding protein [Deltaproteobacteria bacterium]|nr:extracellular solute-binding protein [Deltaproteobacteria bacterium]
MEKGFGIFRYVAVLALVAWGSVASAQDAATVAAAKKEGKVVWYTSLALPSSTALAKLFMDKYKGIEVEVHRSGSQRVLQRMMQEVSAGIKNADIVHTSDAGHFVLLKEKGLLMKYTPTGTESFPAGFKDKSGFYYGMRATLTIIPYNPKLVSEKDAPKTWKELLDPKWKGKMVTAHPGYSGIIMTHWPRTGSTLSSLPTIQPAWWLPGKGPWAPTAPNISATRR